MLCALLDVHVLAQHKTIKNKTTAKDQELEKCENKVQCLNIPKLKKRLNNEMKHFDRDSSENDS